MSGPGDGALHGSRICTYCGCTCDDIGLRARGGRIVEAAGACPEGEEWFRGIVEPSVAARVDGRPAEEEEALEVAVRVLAGARSPLVFGLDEASGEAQEWAVAVADTLGGALDVAGSAARAPWTAAFQRRGAVSATLAEVRNRADLFVFWRVDPEKSHPRFLERFVEPEGVFVSGPRTLVRVGDTVAGSPAREAAAPGAGRRLTLRIPRRHAFEALWVLRALVRGTEPAATGLPDPLPGELERLVPVLRGCRYGVWVYDPATASEPGDPGVPEATLALVEALNDHVPFAALGLGGRGNGGGAEAVLTAQAGYPFAVSFAAGHPRFGPGEFSADALLRRGEVDAVLVVGCDPARHLEEEALAALRELPLVVVDFRDSELAGQARAALLTAVYGVAAPATVHRMDGVALRARPALPSSLPADGDVLRRLAARLEEGAGLEGSP